MSGTVQPSQSVTMTVVRASGWADAQERTADGPSLRIYEPPSRTLRLKRRINTLFIYMQYPVERDIRGCVMINLFASLIKAIIIYSLFFPNARLF